MRSHTTSTVSENAKPDAIKTLKVNKTEENEKEEVEDEEQKI